MSQGPETCLAEMALHKPNRKRWLKTHTQLQTGIYKPNGRFDIETWLALLLNPGMIWLYLEQATRSPNVT